MRIEPTEWPALSQLLDRMLDLPADEREQWIERLAGAEALWAPRLRELLHGATRCERGSWLDTLPKFDTSADSLAQPLVPGDIDCEPPGAEIGPYRLIRLLGRGGMGSVWYAERSDGLVRRGIALKLPRGLNADEVLAGRFAREREILAGLVHPHIARLYDAGIAADGQPYLALEYVEGESLDDYCDSRSLDLSARIKLFRQVLDAVQYAHSRLVIHRDLKPNNILVTADGEARLLDFGVAKLLDSDAGEAPELTRMGGPGMTLKYASPEQVMGEIVSTATDVYSLGVLLFELAVGAPLYRLKRDSRSALEDAILAGDIRLPSSAVTESAATVRSTTAKKLRRALKGDLDAILLKMLHRQPEQRYVTVAAVTEDLVRFAEGRTVQAHRSSRWYWLRKFIARNRLMVSSAALAGLALLVGASLAIWQGGEARRQAQLANAERNRAQAAAQHREAVDEFMSDLLLDAGRTGKPISIETLITRADELSAREFEREPEARAAVLSTVGQFAWDFNGVNKALPYFDQAYLLIAGSEDEALRAHIVCTRAQMRGALGEIADAQRTLHALIDDPKSSAAAKSECLGNLSRLDAVRYDGAAAEDAASRALEEWQASLNHSTLRRLELLSYLAEAQVLNGKPAAADRGYAYVMQELERLGRARSALGDDVRNDRRSAARYSGDLKLALEQTEAAIERFKEDAPDRPPPALWMYHRSLALADLGRYIEALDGFEHLAPFAASQDRVTQQRAELDEAAVLAKLGRMQEAERHYRIGVAIAGAGVAGQIPMVDIAALLTRAKLDLQAGRFASARQSLTSVLQAASVGAVSLANARRLRALADLGAGNLDEALDDARTAVALRVKQQGDRPFSAWVGEAKLVLGQVWQAKGDVRQAQEAYAGAVTQLTGTVGAEHPELQQANALLAALLKDRSRD
jgi:serine/threonine protein kinase/tetratricopeptide (TPR) repeat protein